MQIILVGVVWNLFNSLNWIRSRFTLCIDFLDSDNQQRKNNNSRWERCNETVISDLAWSARQWRIYYIIDVFELQRIKLCMCQGNINGLIHRSFGKYLRLMIYVIIEKFEEMHSLYTLQPSAQGLYSLSGRTSCRTMSWNVEAARLGFRLFQSQWSCFLKFTICAMLFSPLFEDWNIHIRRYGDNFNENML